MLSENGSVMYGQTDSEPQQLDSAVVIKLVQSVIDQFRFDNDPNNFIDGFLKIKTIKRHTAGISGSGVHLVKYNNVKYVYKPRVQQNSLERKHWDNKPVIDGSTVPQRERAAFLISTIGGFDFVPETILSDTGSIQKFVPNAREANYQDIEMVEQRCAHRTCCIYLFNWQH